VRNASPASRASHRVALQRDERIERARAIVERHEDVVMIRSGHHVAADAGRAQSPRERGRQADRSEIRMHGQRDPRGAKQHGPAAACRSLFVDDDRHAFRFAERRDRFG